MNFVSSAVFSFTAAIIYKYRRSLNGAIVGLFVSVLVTVGAMAVMNILITPIYMKVPRDAVLGLLPTLLLPFNLAKALMNAAITMLIYKPVSIALKRARLIDGKVDTRFTRKSVVMLALGAVTLVVAIVIFVILT